LSEIMKTAFEFGVLSERDPGGFSDGSAPPRSLTSAVYKQLREQILAGAIPPGTKLLITNLTTRFGVSSSVVRESISRLTADGLTEGIDQRGFRVTPVSLKDLDDLTMLRTEVENIALRRSVAAGSKEWAQEVSAAFDALTAALEVSHSDPGLYEALNDRFHTTLISACDSPRLIGFRKQLAEHAARYRRLSLKLGASALTRHESHRRLRDAALAGDADALTAEMTRHIRDAFEAVHRGLATNPDALEL
jgi:DNA-binding GntR family transcriptional regulator